MHRFSRHFRLLGSTLLLLIASSCTADKLQLPADGDARQLTVVSGTGQSGEVGQVLDDSVIVRITDDEGRPVVNQVVAFVALSPAGSRLIPDTVLTDSTGRAVSLWHLGTKAGSQRAEVRIPGTTIKASLSATAIPGVPDTLAMVTGMDQAGRIGSTLPESLVVRLVDRFGNPISGEVIDWTPRYGTVSRNSVPTDSEGMAAVAWQLGLKPGNQKVEASCSGVPGSPATFQAQAYIVP